MNVNDRPETFEQFIAWKRDETPEEQDARRRRVQLDSIAQLDQRNREHRVIMARKLSEVGARFSERTLDSYACPPGDPVALDLARDAAALKHGLWLFGDKGTGKTHLAAGIVNEVTSNAVPATFVSVIALLDRLKASYDRSGRLRENCADVIQWLAQVEVLVLDDLDKAEFTSYVSMRLYALINRRYENGGSQRAKPLIVTSNRTPADLCVTWAKKGLDEVIGIAILDRMRELCGQFICVEGESYRERLMEGA